jgi:hypothetical protein
MFEDHSRIQCNTPGRSSTRLVCARDLAAAEPSKCFITPSGRRCVPPVIQPRKVVRFMNRKFAAVAVAASVVSLFAASSASAFTLNSRSTSSSPNVAQSSTLYNGSHHVASVSGVVSYYLPSLWTANAGAYWQTCGSKSAITTTSPGQSAGSGGADAETIFASPVKRGCGSFKPPTHWSNFEIATTGSSAATAVFSHREPMTGARVAPESDHTYEYALRGTGARARFRLNDTNYADNNGQLTIAVRDAVRSDCDNEGWKAFGDFASDAACRSVLPRF